MSCPTKQVKFPPFELGLMILHSPFCILCFSHSTIILLLSSKTNSPGRYFYDEQVFPLSVRETQFGSWRLISSLLDTCTYFMGIIHQPQFPHNSIYRWIWIPQYAWICAYVWIPQWVTGRIQSWNGIYINVGQKTATKIFQPSPHPALLLILAV